jgi:hypothetical protein
MPTVGPAGRTLPSVEAQRTETGYVFRLTGEERLALVRILRVVEDNWWLDEVERTLLERLEGEAAVLTAA